MRRLPTRGSRALVASIAMIEPMGAPNSARPSWASVRPRSDLTSGICAVQDAKMSPWVMNTMSVAMRARVAASCPNHPTATGGPARSASTTARPSATSGTLAPDHPAHGSAPGASMLDSTHRTEVDCAPASRGGMGSTRSAVASASATWPMPAYDMWSDASASSRP